MADQSTIRIFLISALAIATGVANAARADDWPQWMGPGRDDVWRETGIVDSFPAEGPPIRWRVPIAGGYAGPAVAGGRVFVMDYVKEGGEAENDPGRRAEVSGRERILCLDENNGNILWVQQYPCPYKISYPAGPRATPTVDGERVYCLGAEGKLLCLGTSSGDILWSKDLTTEYGIETPIWGFCGHPLVDGEKLICLVGGEGSVAVAFDKKYGKEMWRALSAPEPGYCPPTMIEAGGVRQLLIWHPLALNALDPETGLVYWSQPLEPSYGMSIMAPRRHGDFLYASGIGGVGALFKLARAKPDAEVAWRGKRGAAVFCANSTPLIDGGVIYGTDCDQGCLCAVALEDGRRLWETYAATAPAGAGEGADNGSRRIKHGTAFLVKNGDRTFLFSETGDLIIARLTPEKYEELGRAHLLEPTGEAFGRSVVWSHPAFADRSIFARNDREIVCASLAKE